MKKNSTRHLCLLALTVALAFGFSYLESLIPLNFGVPGIKLGIANLPVVFALYKMNEKDALFINIVRIVLSGLIFSGVFAMIYSIAGGLLSFGAMVLAKRKSRLSVIGVSALGGAVHNIGQLVAAGFVMKTAKIIYYYPVLLVSGLATGIAVGAASAVLIKRVSLKGDN